MRFACGVFGASADANEPIAAVWNPDSARAIRVLSISVTLPGTTSIASPLLQRTTARGTPGATTSPSAANSFEGGPPPIARIDRGNYTAAPTYGEPPVGRAVVDPREGAGWLWRFEPRGIVVPAGTGLAVVTPVAVTGAANVTFEWLE